MKRLLLALCLVFTACGPQLVGKPFCWIDGMTADGNIVVEYVQEYEVHGSEAIDYLYYRRFNLVNGSGRILSHSDTEPALLRNDCSDSPGGLGKCLLPNDVGLPEVFTFADGSTLTADASNQILRAAADGTQLWAASGYVNAPLRGKLVLVSDRPNALALDLQTGAQLWTIAPPESF
jgi:hypothetical protein